VKKLFFLLGSGFLFIMGLHMYNQRKKGLTKGSVSRKRYKAPKTTARPDDYMEEI
jgi:hypothetical protein